MTATSWRRYSSLLLAVGVRGIKDGVVYTFPDGETWDLEANNRLMCDECGETLPFPDDIEIEATEAPVSGIPDV